MSRENVKFGSPFSPSRPARRVPPTPSCSTSSLVQSELDSSENLSDDGTKNEEPFSDLEIQRLLKMRLKQARRVKELMSPFSISFRLPSFSQ